MPCPFSSSSIFNWIGAWYDQPRRCGQGGANANDFSFPDSYTTKIAVLLHMLVDVDVLTMPHHCRTLVSFISPCPFGYKKNQIISLPNKMGNLEKIFTTAKMIAKPFSVEKEFNNKGSVLVFDPAISVVSQCTNWRCSFIQRLCR